MIKVLAIGLMSGTSADGVDAALVRTDGSSRPEVLGALHRTYPPELRRAILALYQPGSNELDRLGVLDRHVGKWFAKAALAVCQQVAISPEQIRVVGSHGQTVRHRPPIFTMQIGSPFEISAMTGITTVADFRPADMVRGGEGAPLTPLYHHCLFGRAGRRIAVVNLGGIANITALSGHEASNAPADLLAGDCGPANSLIDLLAEETSHGAQLCDLDGAMAAAGQVDPGALAWLLAHPYLARPFPKSTGREIFGQELLDDLRRCFDQVSIVDLFATLTEFTAASVAEACRSTLPPQPEQVVLCGGGAHNPEIVRRLQANLTGSAVVTSADLGVDTASLEAQAFAWFAVRSLRGWPSSLPGATGAGESAVLGAIYPGRHGSKGD